MSTEKVNFNAAVMRTDGYRYVRVRPGSKAHKAMEGLADSFAFPSLMHLDQQNVDYGFDLSFLRASDEAEALAFADVLERKTAELPVSVEESQH